MDAALITARQDRGRTLAQGKRASFRQLAGDTYLVPSATNAGSVYVVNATTARCTCPDYETYREPCKHVWACRYRFEIRLPDGTSIVTETVRFTYPQPNWSAYNQAQTNEKDVSRILLRSLCDTVITPPHPGRGPKPIPYADAIYGLAWKVYSTWSGRRATSDIRACADAGLLTRAPSYNALFDAICKPELTPLLQDLIELSASPLRAVERRFAPDATGFATPAYCRWFDYRHGDDRRVKHWVKAHAFTGTLSNIIVAVEVTKHTVHDTTMFPPLLDRALKSGFTIEDVPADKGYLSNKNVTLIEAAGAKPWIPFKINSGSKGSPAWERMYHMWSLNRESFDEHYGDRQNVESTFSAMKRVFGASLRSKGPRGYNPDTDDLPASMVNEVLLKCLCFNLSTVVHSIYELRIDPTFCLPKVPQ